MHCLKGRTIVASAAGHVYVIDVVTGLCVWSATRKDIVFDSSGALAFRGSDGSTFVSSDTTADGHKIAFEPNSALHSFRFGALVMNGRDRHCVLRFDIDAPLASDGHRKVM